MSSLNLLKEWLSLHRSEILADYFQFLRFQSISADRACSKEIRNCASWLRDYLQTKGGMDAELIETEGYPLVVASRLATSGSARTVLIYGHYDVQPIDPLELWLSDPFEPVEREGKIYARGAVDDKGQIFYAIAAVRALKELKIPLNAHLKFCIEGEEESSSLGLSRALPKLRNRLQADFLIGVDSDQYDPQTPAITLGTRGMAAFQVSLTGSKGDLHSGLHGGIAYNPNRALAELLSKVWDREGRIQIEGFYDGIQEIPPFEKKEFSFYYDEKSYSEEFGVDAIGGEKGRSLADKNGFRPTFEINGMSGGYTGPGFKTVIPARAVAKISCRLVPDQDPDRIKEAVCRFFQKETVPGMKLEIDYLGGERAFWGNPRSAAAKAVAQAAFETTGIRCRQLVSGGSIPILAAMMKELKAEALCMGYGLPTDAIHAPNEHFDWSRFEKGFLTIGRALELI